MATTARPLLLFGANTDVGKTVCAAGLVRAALRRDERALYVKPVQTGARPDDDGDARADATWIRRCVRGSLLARGAAADRAAALDADLAERLEHATLFGWERAVSPHLAAASGGAAAAPSDAELLAALRARLARGAGRGLALVETAGGVLSPAPSGSLQADAYAPLFAAGAAPVALVGDGRLGGISATLCALEALRARGARVRALALIEASDEPLENAAFVREHVAGGGRGADVHVAALPRLPPPSEDLSEWLRDTGPAFDEMLACLRE